MVELLWTDSAAADLHSIYEYIANDSKVYAERVVDKIVKRAEQVLIHPNSGRVVPEFNNIQLREIIEGSYRIIYQLKDDKIFIIRIYHAARLLS